MLILSRHFTDCGLKIPENAIVRLNLAWEPSIKELKLHLGKFKKNDIMIDVPIGRKKAPNTRWNIDEIIEITNHPRVKYLAISNVNEAEDLMLYLFKVRHSINIIPKIESLFAIENIEEITNFLRLPKIISLDTEDLFTDLVRQRKEKFYSKYMRQLFEDCEKLDVKVLGLCGVGFSELTKEKLQKHGII